MRKRQPIKILGAALLIGLAVIILAPLFSFKSLTGCWFPKTIDEPLESPIEVSSISVNGIQLNSGTVVSIPGVKQIPIGFEPLEVAVQEGVEIDESGEIYGRLRIHHWCGNDPVRTHYTRINLADLIWTYENLEEKQ